MNRSLLFVPVKERLLNKIPTLSSDGYILDLEDSINESDKDSALEELCKFLNTYKGVNNIVVRLNKDRCSTEVLALDKYDVGFMLPKFEQNEDYLSLERIWNKHTIIALIETPLGIVNIKDIAQCKWVDALAFGAEDYTASMNMQNADELLIPTKSLIVAHAKGFGKTVYDTPSFQLTDQDAFEREVRTSVALGFDGKLLINPKQIDFVNNSFGEANLEHLKYIVSEYERLGEAVAVIDGKVYEKMHINRFRRVIKEYKTD